jgi:hypothetical protein
LTIELGTCALVVAVGVALAVAVAAKVVVVVDDDVLVYDVVDVMHGFGLGTLDLAVWILDIKV